MARKPTGNPTGRPPRDFDPKIFEELCFIQCTNSELESVLRCNVDSLDYWCTRHYGEPFRACYKRFSEGGKSSLRRAQIRTALKGNATLLIWLGKTMLGQRDPDKQQDVYITKEALNEFMDHTRNPVAKESLTLPNIS